VVAAWDLAFHCNPAGYDRFGIRQGATGAFDTGMVHASEMGSYRRTNGPLAMSILRACVGGLARFSRSIAKRNATSTRIHHGDLAFLERVFHKLMLNFTWWVNRKDGAGQKYLPGRISRPG
jgi:hypothetical protein